MTTNRASFADVVEAVAWAKTCLIIASHADGDDKLQRELTQLEAANKSVRELVGLEIDHLPQGLQLEIKICEKGLVALREQGDVSTRRKRKI